MLLVLASGAEHNRAVAVECTYIVMRSLWQYEKNELLLQVTAAGGTRLPEDLAEANESIWTSASAPIDVDFAVFPVPSSGRRLIIRILLMPSYRRSHHKPFTVVDKDLRVVKLISRFSSVVRLASQKHCNHSRVI